MKQINATLIAFFLFAYASAQSGTLDGTFNNSGTPGYRITDVVNGGDDYAQSMSLHSDGRIVVTAYNENNYVTLLRYTSTGTLDGSFGTGGIVTLRYAPGEDAQAYAVTVLSDNKILVAGYSWGSTKDFALLRLNEDGTPDLTFGANGWVITPVGSGDDEARSMLVQNDGKILVAGVSDNGSNKDFALIRYNSDGSLDNLFATGGKGTTDINGDDMPESLAVQSDGKILVAGSSNTAGAADFAVVRYNTDGSLDGSGPGFGTGGIVTVDIGFGGPGSYDFAHSVTIQPDGKILLAGQADASGLGNDDVAIIRLTPNGALDAGPSGFGGDGIVTFNYGPLNTDEEARSIIIQSDGKILVAGGTEGSGSSFSLMLLRYTADASLDPTFGPGANGIATSDITNTNDVGYAMALYGTRIYVAGTTGDNFSKQVIIAAFQNNYTTLPLTLLNFNAEKLTNKVDLHWQTSDEENLNKFIVEASSNGKIFKAIGYILPTGNSNTVNNYSFTDQLPYNGDNYYRLLMQDIDGKYKYSKVVQVNTGEITSFQVYPCPAKEIVQVLLPVSLRGTINLSIIDMQGRVVKSNHISSDGNVIWTSIDLHSLPNGIFILQAQAGTTRIANRIIKQ